MGFFGPTRQERQAAAAAAVAPYGFRLIPPENERLKLHLAPFALHSAPDRCVASAYGKIDQAEVYALEYDYSYRDQDGNEQTSSQMIVAVYHPRILGGAAFMPDMKQWSGIAAALDLMLWVPPFTFVKALQLFFEAKNPDRVIGHAEFDRLYVVRAASDADAARAIPPRLRETAVQLAFRGTVELRENLLIYSVQGCRFDGDGLLTALRYAAPLTLAAMTDSGAAYR
ncbi:MAG: hypothetical protein U0234_28540 [Sandaracinus sp.]